MTTSSVNSDHLTAFQSPTVHASSPIITSIEEQVAASEGPISLDFYGKKLENVQALEIFQTIMTNRFPTITSLDLGSNQLGHTCGDPIGKMLALNTHLESLSLDRNPLTPDGLKHIAPALKGNTTLTTLLLERTGVDDTCAQLFAQALTFNTTLTSLDLTGENIGPVGGSAIGEMLTSNAHLRSLELACNPLRESGVTAIARALQANTSLTHLSLGFVDRYPDDYDDSGDDEREITVGYGMHNLALALTSNTTLTALDLQGIDLGDEDGEALAQALKVNTTLLRLDLREHSFSSDGAGHALLEALVVNTTLEEIDLCEGGNCFEGFNVDEILRFNPSLTSIQLEMHGFDLTKRNMHNKLMRNASFAHMLSVYLESSTHSPWGSFTLRSLLADFEKLENRSCTDQEFAQASHQICQNLICLIWTSSDQEAKDFPELLPVYKKYGELLRTETHRSFREAAGLPPDDGTIEWCEMCFYQQDRPEMTRELTDLRIRAINSVTKPFYRRLYPDSYQSPFTY